MRTFLFLILPLVALAIPPPITPIRSALEKREDFIPYRIEDACRKPDSQLKDVNRYQKVASAVKNARTMAKLALKEWWDEGKHGEAAATYLAIPNDGKYKENVFAQRVHANLQSITLLDGRVPFLSRVIDVHCTDISGTCKKKPGGANQVVAGYAENTYHFLGGWHYDVVLCEPFFLTLTPGEVARYWPTSSDFKAVSMDYLENDAGKMLHEMMHINLITADRPHVPDKYYQGERAYTAPLIADWVLKAKARTEDVVQNADSYTQFVNAVFFTSKFGFLPPPAKKEPLDEELQCFGYDNEYVDKSQDKFIKDFCHKVAAEYKPFSSGRIEHEYDEGLPGQVRFKLHRTSDGTLPSDEVERQCNSAMSKIFHGCDTSTNWKHGGAYAFTKDKKEIYTYLVEPARSRPDPIPAKLPGTCDVWYKFWHAEFFIHGGLWAEGDYGQDKLLPNLRRCGVVTAWKFEYREESDKDNLEWYAYGHLPVGAQQWNCVRQAVVDSGGPPDIGCGGK